MAGTVNKRQGAAALLAVVVATVATHGGDSYWTAGSGIFSAGGNWSGGTPGAADNAHFTNNATYTVTWDANAQNTGAYFDAPGATVSLDVDAYTYTVTDALQLGADSAAGAGVKITDGHVLVSNASGTATVNIGPSGAGSLELNGGALTAQRLVLTNTSAAGMGSSDLLLFRNSTLTTYGADILYPANGTPNTRRLFVGNDEDDNAWHVLGGTNRVTSYENGNGIQVGDRGRRNRLVVAGEGTLLATSNATDSVNGGGLIIGGHTYFEDNMMIVSNKARVHVDGPGLLNGGEAKLLVTDTGTVFYVAGYFYLYYHDCELVVSNGAVFHCRGSFSLHSSGGGVSNTTVVTGEGTLFTNTAASYMQAGQDSHFIVRDGAMANVSYPWFSAPQTQIMVTDTGSIYISRGSVYCHGGHSYPAVVATNGGTVKSSGLTLCNLADTTGSCLVTGEGSLWTNTGTASIGYQTDTHGTLRIEDGGLYNGRHTLVATADGSTGIVEIVGSGSILTNRQEFRLAEHANGEATLRFVADAEGVGHVGVGSAVTIKTGAKLEVDLSDYRGYESTQIDLVVYSGSRVGEFAAGDTTITLGPTVESAQVVHGAAANDRIYLEITPVPTGTIIKIR